MANTIKFGNGNWAIKDGSTLAYNDENENFKPLPFDFSRASKATVVNKEGLIETVGNDMPRIDYLDNSKGALLLEPQRTNLITYSEDFSDASWTKSRVSVTSGFTSPDGANNAYKLVNNSSNGLHSLIGSNVSSSNTDYSLSLFVKAEEVNKIGVRDAITGLYLTYDISTDTVIESNVASYNISKLTNGWNRVSIVFQGSGSAIIQPKIYLLNDSYISGNPQSYSYIGNGTDGLYIYGAQLEEGSYSTSLIKTQGSTATRVQDECNEAGNEQVINSTEGVLFAEISALANDGAVRYISLSDGTSANRVVILYYSSSDNIRMIVSSNGTNYVDKNHSVSSVLDFHKIAIKYKENDFALWIDGIEAKADNSGNTPIGLDNLSFSMNGGDNFYGKCKDLRVYDVALTDQELADLTTI